MNVPYGFWNLLLAGLVAQGLAADTSSSSADVSRILERNCVVCHGPEVRNANVRLDNLSTDVVGDRRAAETWRDVRDALNSGAMPPPDAPRMALPDREAVLDWLSVQLAKTGEARRTTTGHGVIRRLNRVEYQNTMRDLLGLDLDYAANLPPDELSPDGFSNNGLALGMSRAAARALPRRGSQGAGSCDR